MSFIRRMWGFTFFLWAHACQAVDPNPRVRLVLVFNYCFSAFNKIYNNFFQTSLNIFLTGTSFSLNRLDLLN